MEYKIIKDNGSHQIYESDLTIMKIYSNPLRKGYKIASKLAQLIPEYVPKVYLETSTVLVMEKIQGMTLNDYFTSDQMSDKIILSLINALFAMHDNGYLHRDFHDKNIIITKDHKVKIIDFDRSVSIYDYRCKTISDLVYCDYVHLKEFINKLSLIYKGDKFDALQKICSSLS